MEPFWEAGDAFQGHKLRGEEATVALLNLGLIRLVFVNAGILCDCHHLGETSITVFVEEGEGKWTSRAPVGLLVVSPSLSICSGCWLSLLNSHLIPG